MSKFIENVVDILKTIIVIVFLVFVIKACSQADTTTEETDITDMKNGVKSMWGLIDTEPEAGIKDYGNSIDIRTLSSEELSEYAMAPVFLLDTRYKINAETDSYGGRSETDEFGNQISLEAFDTDGNPEMLECVTVSFCISDLYYKDRLNVILKDTKKYIDFYTGKSRHLLFIVYDNKSTLLEWFADIPLEEGGRDEIFITVSDYVSYLYHITSLTDISIDDNEGFYTCKAEKNIYDIDVLTELNGKNDYTAGDVQRKNKSILDKDTKSAVDYWAFEYQLDYSVYFSSDEKQVYFYVCPQGKDELYGTKGKNILDNLSADTNKFSSHVYDTTKIIAYSKANKKKKVYQTENGKVTLNKLT